MPKADLKRELGFFDSVMLIAGTTIGIGIFVTTGLVAQHIPSPGGILLIWLLGGLLALTGALSCAELGASLPYAGGDYIYLKEAYGHLAGFLSGWSSFFVTFSGSVASLAVGFTAYAAFFFPFLEVERAFFSTTLWGMTFHLAPAHLFSISMIWILSAIHISGIKPGSRLQNLLTFLKLAALLGIVLLALVFGRGSLNHFSPFFDQGGAISLSALGAAFIPVLFTYAGWNAAIYLAGEVREPGQTLPRALLWGNLLIIFVYLAVNATYIYGVPIEKMQGAVRVAELATSALFPYHTSALITMLIALSVLGALNAVIMIGPRIYYAMAQDRLFFGGLANISPRTHTPVNAIILQSLWASILILSGTFDALLTYVTVMIVLFSALTVGALLVLRTKRPDLQRPYKIWGYPIVPWIFIIAHTGIGAAIFWENPMETILGAGIVIMGIPAYFLWKNRVKGEGRGGHSE